jgi:cytochrome c55X
MSAKTIWLLPLILSMATVIIPTVEVGAFAKNPTHERKTALTNLIRHDCGSCHGMTLKGGLGKPLLPETLAQFDAIELEEIILDGVPGTPMPPWRELLTVSEAKWMVEQLQSGTIMRGNSR